MARLLATLTAAGIIVVPLQVSRWRPSQGILGLGDVRVPHAINRPAGGQALPATVFGKVSLNRAADRVRVATVKEAAVV